MSPPSPPLANLDSPSPASPIPRSKSAPRPDVVVQNPSPVLPPPPQSYDDDFTPRRRHQREFSIDSKSSYRTSLASTHYDSRRCTAVSSGSRFLDDAPPLPSGLAASSLDRERYGRFDFSASDSNSYRDEIEQSGLSPFRDSSLPSARGSTDQLSLRIPSHPSPFGLSDLPEEQSAPHPLHAPSRLLPPGREPSQKQNGSLRKKSDANSDGPVSVSNFARALDLDARSTAGSSVASDFSQSESRSGTPLSSLASDASFSRRKPSDLGRLGPVVEERQPESSGMLGEEERVRESPTDMVPAALFTPDSPTDPAISQGSLSLVPDAPTVPEFPPDRPIPARSATTPPSRPRPKGRCRGCGELIQGKSVSSADGRLTGRYHRACFVCCYCYVPFRTADFYVLDDRPYCAQHYHELNDSLCRTCHTGIEGKYLETVERQGRGVADRQKFHPNCLRCRACRVLLQGDYFEWNGQVFCERDAFRAAWTPPSPRRPRRPTLPSPLSQSHDYPPPSPDGRPDLRPPRPPYSPGPRRYPERRTTRLMMT